MHLNLPIMEHLKQSKHILIAGMGGGYDVFSGLPIYFELEKQGFDVHLANFSFSDIDTLTEGEILSDMLVGVNIDIEGIFDYFPEYFLAQWFYDSLNEFVTVWSFHKTGVRPLVQNYKLLIKHLNIDTIILIDGGIDSLMTVDEPEPGTILEDTISLCAVSELVTVPTRILGTIGLGVEFEVEYPYLFENMSNLIKSGAFIGSCSLTNQMDVFKQYEDASLFVFEQQPDYPSVICSSVISATRGEYGDFHMIKRTKGSQLRISPLMSIYWFFDAAKVARQNQLASKLRLTYTIDDAWKAMQRYRKTVEYRPLPIHPLP